MVRKWSRFGPQGKGTTPPTSDFLQPAGEAEGADFRLSRGEISGELGFPTAGREESLPQAMDRGLGIRVCLSPCLRFTTRTLARHESDADSQHPAMHAVVEVVGLPAHRRSPCVQALIDSAPDRPGKAIVTPELPFPWATMTADVSEDCSGDKGRTYPLLLDNASKIQGAAGTRFWGWLVGFTAGSDDAGMFQITVKTDPPEKDELGPADIRAALVDSVNLIAKAARLHVTEALPIHLDRPTPFTMKAICQRSPSWSRAVRVIAGMGNGSLSGVQPTIPAPPPEPSSSLQPPHEDAMPANGSSSFAGSGLGEIGI
ncbi:hypothetical protein AIGOOFII_1966 [Methylobacterium marchantiae]|nr:hypothetical protein AIGOOFII_1966 [Methylobacterium marchantiae]